ncbi:Ribosome maturation factor RimP [Planktothrix tepida]|uniref:Ribosome maturation factor RimP n=3 Tax=Planktothrix TaxID=54304 RepID=A0A1J1LSK0_9CYAN|nr:MULTISPECIES: ribosome maturation factor RimP [Planktothrix]MBD2484129.1 ribosome maturation factor RimP [Planktothrix sp. FACHB-1365]MBE9146808.1 ribosome maturation factor RimP [Planktothrix mougeotii LEGE 06226]CAD5948246.1 Ribosome maturation factor RimP [Planktothrix pseudagardhii]CAD5962405.1 Ribosome maturation factor RimP [Planktothrix tepida]CUR34820.1 Ribosome maturation factor RimP [Planktothrix tepida PCC 9214]
MAHPLIPEILDIATPIAQTLGLEVVGATFYTNQKPPVLRVDIRNPSQDTGLDDCERMSRALEEQLETTNIIPDAYVLEISSPGISQFLTSDREFISFKGFPIIVKTSEPYKGQTQQRGKLVRRDETTVYLSQKGRQIAIPRELVTEVLLDESGEE